MSSEITIDLRAFRVAGAIPHISISSAASSALKNRDATITYQAANPAVPAKRPLTEQEFMELQYREGKLANLPHPEPLTQEEQAERERLGRLFASDKPMSELVIEDRGPY